MHDENYVSDEEWARWEAERLEASARRSARLRREAVKPVEPTKEDLRMQLHALRHHNEALVSELERLRDWATRPAAA